jgi:hypothetical protein
MSERDGAHVEEVYRKRMTQKGKKGRRGRGR